MRLTTKIIFGIIASIFIFSSGIIIYISFIDVSDYEYSYEANRPKISQENIIPVDIKPYKTIWIDEEWIEEEIKKDWRNLFPEGTLFLQPVINENEKNKIFMPEDLLQYTNIISSNDTLIIRLKMGELYKKYVTVKERPGMGYILNGINFFIYTNTVDIINNVSNIKVDIRNIKTDKIYFNTVSEIFIDSCMANLIDFSNARAKRFLLKNSHVKEVNIDLDYNSNFNIGNSDIEVENITGSGNKKIIFNESRVKTMNWFPKNENAQLVVTLKGDTARIMFP